MSVNELLRYSTGKFQILKIVGEDMNDRQQSAPIILQSQQGQGQRLAQVPLGKPPFRENVLQKLLAEHPEVLPINEIEPAFQPLIFLGREIPTRVGSIDLLYSTPAGYLTIVETKLWDNPEARRQVVAQIIDYATEISYWSFDELRAAIGKSQNENGDLPMIDIVENIKTKVDDLDQTNYIDSISRNLRKGNFLLLVVGNGIHEGVENISEYLQKNPSLHYSLALVELNLYRLNKDQDYPLYVQPRTLAKTIELVRAIVDIKAPPELDISVKIPTEEEVKKGKSRRRLTEEIFFEELAANKSKEFADQVYELMMELKDMGLVSIWRSSSVSMRFPDPGGSGYLFTVIVFDLSGTAYIGWLERINFPEYGGYDINIALSYRNCIANIVGMPQKENCYLEDLIPVHKLLAYREDFLNCVRRFTGELIKLAKEKQEE